MHEFTVGGKTLVTAVIDWNMHGPGLIWRLGTTLGSFIGVFRVWVTVAGRLQGFRPNSGWSPWEKSGPKILENSCRASVSRQWVVWFARLVVRVEGKVSGNKLQLG